MCVIYSPLADTPAHPVADPGGMRRRTGTASLRAGHLGRRRLHHAPQPPEVAAGAPPGHHPGPPGFDSDPQGRTELYVCTLLKIECVK